MLYNIFTIKKDLKGDDYIQIINPDYSDEDSFEEYWRNLIFALRNLIPNSEAIENYFFYEKYSLCYFCYKSYCDYLFDNDESNDCSAKMNNIERIGNTVSIVTSIGKIKINTYNYIIETDGNIELLEEINLALENSSYFTKMTE